jgi:hypothetical protein
LYNNYKYSSKKVKVNNIYIKLNKGKHINSIKILKKKLNFIKKYKYYNNKKT